MANSKYEYVKTFEIEKIEDEIMFPDLMVVQIDGHEFHRFGEVHEFEKPNDKRALDLMNSCAISVLEAYPDIVLAYGFSDEYSFVFKYTSKFYQRRSTKILSIISSFFTAVYVRKWGEFFSQKELQYPPCFHARVINCASIEVLQGYLLWRENVCHSNNQYDECFWRLLKHGMSEKEARGLLKGAKKCDLNDILFDRFNVNYNMLDAIFRQGSCVIKAEVEDTVKYNGNGDPVKRLRRSVQVVHSKKVANKNFWNNQPVLLKELGEFSKDINNVKPEYIRRFELERKLLPLTWIVVRIDGCHFHRFSADHEFVKPNDERALNLMNSCAVAVAEGFPEIVFAYGVSDEYSFVLRRNSQFCARNANKIVSIIVSFFSAVYVMRWRDFFPRRELKYIPSFDGRAVCYPTTKILRDYLAWRQVDCHINNQYNSCFWKLVESGKSKTEAQRALQGAQLQQRLEELGIQHSKIPAMFRQGSSIFRIEEENSGIPHENGEHLGSRRKQVILEHCDIIGPTFWQLHPSILDDSKDDF